MTTQLMPEAELQALLDRIQTLEQNQATLTKENGALRAAVKSQPAHPEQKVKEIPALPQETFEVGCKVYRFIARHFHIGGEYVTATDALASTEILEALVTKESGVIAEVV